MYDIFGFKCSNNIFSALVLLTCPPQILLHFTVRKTSTTDCVWMEKMVESFRKDNNLDLNIIMSFMSLVSNEGMLIFLHLVHLLIVEPFWGCLVETFNLSYYPTFWSRPKVWLRGTLIVHCFRFKCVWFVNNFLVARVHSINTYLLKKRFAK